MTLVADNFWNEYKANECLDSPAGMTYDEAMVLYKALLVLENPPPYRRGCKHSPALDKAIKRLGGHTCKCGCNHDK